MDNHPIPQDVTGFQFKLIGNMTLKQFLFLAGGSIVAWIFYALPLLFYIKLPLVLFFAGLGFSFAFLPIEGRPMDTMLSFFIKALFAPDQYIYNKTGIPLDIKIPSPRKTKKPKRDENLVRTNQQDINKILSEMAKKSEPKKNNLDTKEDQFFKTIESLSPATITFPSLQPVSLEPEVLSMKVVSQPASLSLGGPSFSRNSPTEPPPRPVNQQEKPIEFRHENPEELEKELDEEAGTLQKQLQETQVLENPYSLQKAEELAKQLEEILREKKQLEQELSTLKAKLDAPRSASTANTKSSQKPFVPSSTFAPEAPNLVTGVIKNPKGNVLPNILVDISDTQGNPVRAFKTNIVGQFASATPLPNGIYKISFEDASAKYKFAPLELKTEGNVIPPLEISAIDERDELRKDLFGQVSQNSNLKF